LNLVAEAFYAAEYSGFWKDAPEPLRARFRNLARLAIALLGEQMAQCRSSAVAAPTVSSQRAHWEKAVAGIGIH